jgi:hypothetical protein
MSSADAPQPISDSDAASVPSRQCGRCRAVFPGDPTIPFGTMPDWWLCPPCHTALLGPPKPRTDLALS